MSAPLEQFSDFARTTLTSPLIAGTFTTLTVANAAAFPQVPQFRIVVDPQGTPEVMLVTAVSGNTFTVTPGYEGSTQNNHAAGVMVVCGPTAGVMQSLSQQNWGTRNFLNDYPAAINSFADQTANAQYSLLNTQIYGHNFKSSEGLDDQILRHWEEWDMPFNTTPDINCPIIVPEFVDARIKCGLKRDGVGGTVTSNYNGDVTSRALANLYQPCLILPINGHCAKADVYCNPDGVHVGAGVVIGKNWVCNGVTLVTSGGGVFTPGQILTLPNPSKSPYFPTRVTVDTVDGSGNILTYHASTFGAYALPDKLQQYQWTAANGYTGSTMANGTIAKVFDPASLAAGTAAYVSSNSSGVLTTALWTMSWAPDWATGNATYFTGNQLVGDTVVDHLRVISGFSPDPAVGDATYGFISAVTIGSLNTTIQEVETNGGDIGINVTGTDVRCAIANPVKAGRNLVINGGFSNVFGVVELDTASVTYLDVDQCGQIKLKNVQVITGDLVPALSSGYCGRIGFNSSSAWYVEGLDLDISFRNCGQAAGATGMYVAYLKAGEINAKATNYKSHGVAGANFVNQLYYFGPGIDPSCVITGMIDWGGLFPPSSGGTHPSAVPSSTYNADGTPLPIFGGTMPACRVELWNADVVGTGVPGLLDNSGNYTISGSTPPTTGNWPVNTVMTNTAPAAGNPRGWYCSVAGTNNNGGTWTPL